MQLYKDSKYNKLMYNVILQKKFFPQLFKKH